MSSDAKLIAAGRAVAKRNMQVLKEGVAAQNAGKNVKQAMKDKYIEQRGGNVTMRPGYDYSLGGSKEADKNYF